MTIRFFTKTPFSETLNNQNIRLSYSEKRLAIAALIIGTLTTLIGGVLAFYGVSYYFRNKRVSQLKVLELSTPASKTDELKSHIKAPHTQQPKPIVKIENIENEEAPKQEIPSIQPETLIKTEELEKPKLNTKEEEDTLSNPLALQVFIPIKSKQKESAPVQSEKTSPPPPKTHDKFTPVKTKNELVVAGLNNFDLDYDDLNPALQQDKEIVIGRIEHGVWVKVREGLWIEDEKKFTLDDIPSKLCEDTDVIGHLLEHNWMVIDALTPEFIEQNKEWIATAVQKQKDKFLNSVDLRLSSPNYFANDKDFVAQAIKNGYKLSNVSKASEEHRSVHLSAGSNTNDSNDSAKSGTIKTVVVAEQSDVD